MSKRLTLRIREMLGEIHAAAAHPPRIERDGDHVVVKGPPDPLRKDFVSSGREAKQKLGLTSMVQSH